MRIKRFSWRTFLVLSMVFTSCKKHDNPQAEPISKPPTEVGGIKKYIPVKFESDDQIITLKYLDATGLLSEMENSDGRRDVFIYNNDQQLVTYERYENNEQTYSADYFRNTAGMVIKANQFNITLQSYEPTGYYTLTYNTQNQLSSVKSYKNNGELISDKTKTYNSEGNIEEIRTIITNTPDHLMTLTYDQKNGIFKHVSNSGLLAIDARDNFFLSIINNIQTCSDSTSTQSSLTYSYVYNSDDYPAQYTLTSGSSKKIFKITYKLL